MRIFTQKRQMFYLFLVMSVFVSTGPLNADQTSGESLTVRLQVPGTNGVGVMTRSNWESRVREDESGSTLRLTGHRFSIQLTFIPRQPPGDPDESRQIENVRKIAGRYVAGSKEQAIYLRRMSTKIGSAILANFNEQRYENEPQAVGEFSSITVGQIDHFALRVAVTILTDSPNSPQHDDALLVLESITLLDEASP